MIKVTIWNENIHEREMPEVIALYPKGIHGQIADYLAQNPEYQVRTATLDQEHNGLPDEILEDTDVLIWWGHCGHDQVPDELVSRIVDRVHLGMGFIALHSAHYSKPFRKLMGTTCSLRWRDDEFERVWCTDIGHPIAAGIPACFELTQEEMYGEFFDIPKPESVVFTGWFRGGEVFRSGCCWTRGAGKIFYFQPGHETNPSYQNPYVLQIISNAVKWAAPVNFRSTLGCFHYGATTTEERYAQGLKEEY